MKAGARRSRQGAVMKLGERRQDEGVDDVLIEGINAPVDRLERVVHLGRLG